MSYLTWNTVDLANINNATLGQYYNQGYLCTRPREGNMEQTRSMRIDLAHFELSSENRRVLRKTESIELEHHKLPYTDYTWEIGAMAKHFYDTKFGPNTMSANKVRELLTGRRKDFTTLLSYSDQGFCICVETPELLHYAYPFYNLDTAEANMGMGMMLKAIVYVKEAGKKYIYLGSAQRPTDTYKLQFTGLEWFTGSEWSADQDALKQLLQEKV